MDKFEDAFKKISKVNLATHIELWGEPKTEKLYFEAGQQSRQAEVDQLKNLLEKDEYAHNLYYENANLQTLVEEKDKRIERALLKWSSLASILTTTDMIIVPDDVFVRLDELGEALRGEHES